MITTSVNGSDGKMEVVDTRIPVLDSTLTLAIRIWYPPNRNRLAINVKLDGDGHGGTGGGSLSPQQQPRCIAYPGWLDNVGSFENIAPLLCEQLDIVIAAVEYVHLMGGAGTEPPDVEHISTPPGCGWSDHRAAQSPYADYEEPPLIGDIADGLGWDTFGLIGHSRGGAVCAFAAALFPERVLFLIAFDSGLGLSGVWLKDIQPGAPTPVQRMRLAREQHMRNRSRKMTVFKTVEDAIEANMNNPVFVKSRSTATNIVKRHLRPASGGGFTFTHDMRTYGQSQYVCLTEDQTRAFLRDIQCPVLRICCRPEEKRYPAAYRQYYAERMKCVRGMEEIVVPGGHHVHSDDAPATAAAVVRWMTDRGFVSVRAKL